MNLSRFHVDSSSSLPLNRESQDNVGVHEEETTIAANKSAYLLRRDRENGGSGISSGERDSRA